jgi:hypothetical protein
MTETTSLQLDELAHRFDKMGYPLLASRPILKEIFDDQDKDQHIFNLPYPQADPDGTIHALTLERKNQAISLHSVTLTRAVPHDNPLENPAIYFRTYTEHYYIDDKQAMIRDFKTLQENRAFKDVLSENIALKAHLKRLGFDPETLIHSVAKPLSYIHSRFNALSLHERVENKDYPDLAKNRAFIGLTLHNMGAGHFIDTINASLIFPFGKEKGPASIKVQYKKSPSEFPTRENILRELIVRHQIQLSSERKAYEVLNTIQKTVEQPLPAKKNSKII